MDRPETSEILFRFPDTRSQFLPLALKAARFGRYHSFVMTEGKASVVMHEATFALVPLETAAQLEASVLLKRGTLYRLAKCGAIPSYTVGPKRTGVRFRRSEVLAALRRPAAAETTHGGRE